MGNPGKPTGWEAAYRVRPKADYMTDNHHEDCQVLDEIFQRSGVRCILDLGCGDGRHLVRFARLGYHMHGQDISPTGLKLARVWLAKESLSADLACGDMTRILWPDSSFDAMLCIQVINHHRIREIRQTIEEIHRSLRNGGFLFLTVAIDRPPRPDAPKAIEIEPHTYVPTEGHEKDVPHHEFNMAELLDEFRRFSVREDLMPTHRDTNEYTCVLFQKTQEAQPDTALRGDKARRRGRSAYRTIPETPTSAREGNP